MSSQRRALAVGAAWSCAGKTGQPTTRSKDPSANAGLILRQEGSASAHVQLSFSQCKYLFGKWSSSKITTWKAATNSITFIKHMFFCIGFPSNTHNNYCDSQRKVSHSTQTPSSPALLFSWAIFLLGHFFRGACFVILWSAGLSLHPVSQRTSPSSAPTAGLPAAAPLWQCCHSLSSPHSPSHPLKCFHLHFNPLCLWTYLFVKAIPLVVLAASWSRSPTAQTARARYISGCRRTLRRHTECQRGGKPLKLVRHVPALVCKAGAKHWSCNTALHWHYRPYPHVMVHPAMPAYTNKVSSWQRKTGACLQ